MRRLLVLLLFSCGCHGGLVRAPKIYNALITSDENLSPSQAFPILEPVVRTTALGVAFPPLVVQPPQATQNFKEAPTTPPTPSEDVDPKKQPQLSYHGSLYPLAYDPYTPYGYHHDFLYPAQPFYQYPVFVDFGHYENNRKADKEAPAPPKPAINFKKNPDIPDVLPPLPIKDEKTRRS